MTRPIRVLHLEDNPHDAELIRHGLEVAGVGCDVVLVNSREGFEAALIRESFDLIITGAHLATMCGETPYGAIHDGAVTAAHLDEALTALDQDAARLERVNANLLRLGLAAGIGASRIEFPKGMDANEYALKVQPASRSLGVLVRAATWIGNAPARAVHA